MKTPRWLLPFTIFASAVGMLGLISAGYLLVSVNRSLPNVDSIRDTQLKIPLRVYSAEGLLISEFGQERRNPVSLENTPELLRLAVLSSEDDRFYQHQGIDVFGLVRAAFSNIQSGARQQGASTITMQVARNFFLTREKTYIRKLREVMLAFKLEQILAKDEILHLYLNKIFLGHRAYGFGAAAEVYYGRELGQLTLAEIAMLAGLPKAPSSMNPIRNPERAVERRNYVLQRMFDLGHIDDAQFEQASQAPVTASKHAKNIELDAPHIAEMVRAAIFEQYGEQAYWQGLSVYTTVRSAPQRQATQSLRAGIQDYDRRHGFRGAVSHFDLERMLEDKQDDQEENSIYTQIIEQFPSSHEQHPALVVAVDRDKANLFTRDYGAVALNKKKFEWAKRHLTANRVGDRPKDPTQVVTAGDVIYLSVSEQPDASPEFQLSQLPAVSGALISIEPASGRIISLVGGYDFFLNKYNRAVQSLRQPGSNIKPFIYSASLDKGFTPATLISGAPIVMTDPTHGTVWRPENYSGKFYGPTRLREALAKSMNLVSIRLLRSIGIPYVRDYLDRFGIDMNRFPSTLTMALGSGSITPLELLSAYAVIANGGYRVTPYFIDHIVDRNGEVIFRAPTAELCDPCYTDYLPKPKLNEEAQSDEELVEDPASGTATSPDLETNTEPPDLSQPRSYLAPRVMNRANNFLITSILRDVIRRGTARKATVLERPDIAGKTGTTNDYVDAWFSGFNSQIATTVWIGFDDPSTLGNGEAGSTAALPIWINYMDAVLEEFPVDDLQVPEYMEPGWVNRQTGERTDEFDPLAIAEYFPIEALLPEPFGELGLEQAGLDEAALIDPEEPNLIEDPSLSDLDDPLLDDIERIDQSDRIIEDDEETQGLF